MNLSTWCTLRDNCAEVGIIGLFSNTVPLMKFWISPRLEDNLRSLTKSTLFCTMTPSEKCASELPTICKTATCSFVWGCGACSSAAITRTHVSIMCAPVIIVDKSTLCPGQSTTLTRTRSHLHDCWMSFLDRYIGCRASLHVH